MVEQKQQPQLAPLTGLRFVAAAWVVALHIIISLPATQLGVYPKSPYPPLLAVISQGALGVDIFFLLSGFILAYTYTTIEGRLRGTRASFWIARVARIYPVYLLGLLLGIISQLNLTHHSTSGLIGMILTTPVLLQAWVPSLTQPETWNPPSWSLSNEAFFYLLFPLILVWLARLPRQRLLIALAASWATFALLPIVISSFATAHYGAADTPWWVSAIITYNPVMRLPEFVMGVCLGLLFLQRGQSQVQPSSKDDWRFDGALVALVGAIALICVLNPTWPYGYTVSSLETPLFALVILVLAYQRGYIARVLSTPVMIFLGEISYAIYVLHWPIWFLLARVLPAPVPIPLFLVLVGGITSLSYVYIERPARKAIRAWWKQREERMRESVPTAQAPEIVQARTL